MALDPTEPPELIETARLRVRRIRVDDASAIFDAYATDAEATRYLTWPPYAPGQLPELEEFIRSCDEGWRSGTVFSWVITARGDDRAIGSISFTLRAHRIELGYVLGRRYWRRGYVTEVVTALVSWALDEPSIERIWATCDVDNVASAGVLEKCGFMREGVLHKWAVHPNVSPTARDSYSYVFAGDES